MANHAPRVNRHALSPGRFILLTAVPILSALLIVATLAGGLAFLGLGSPISGSNETTDGPPCNPTQTYESALNIPLAGPSSDVAPGGELVVSYQFLISESKVSTADLQVIMPSVFAIFPEANGSNFMVDLSPREIAAAAPGWSNTSWSSWTEDLPQGVDFSPGSTAELTTEGLAVMANAEYGQVTIEFRWDWSVSQPNGGATSSPWSVPTTSEEPPYLSSEFYPAPQVASVRTSPTSTSAGSVFTDTLTGAVGRTSFRLALEYPNGTEIRSVVVESPLPVTELNVSIPVMGADGHITPGSYILHIHDVCNAIVQIFFLTVGSSSMKAPAMTREVSVS